MSKPSFQIEHLLQAPESDQLDFKKEYHRNRATLVHDILCLSNALHSKKRFLVFGIENGTKNITGIAKDPNRKTKAQIFDLLSNAKINHLPALGLHTVLKDGKEIDVLEIKNSRSKPFRLLNDYTHEGTTVRAGVAYCRNGDRNTPINGSATDAEIKLMYLEEMGLNLSPSERFSLYLKDTKGWKYVEERDPSYFFYKKHPEFQIIRHSQRDFDEEWVRQFPDPDAFLTEYTLSYLGVGLDSAFCVGCDGARFYTQLPTSFRLEHLGKEYWAYYLISKGRNDGLRRLFDTRTNGSRVYIHLPVFPSHKIAKDELEKDLKNGAMLYPFYSYDESARAHQRYHQSAYQKIKPSRNRSKYND